MATVDIQLGRGTCQHVTINITHDGETRKFTLTRSEIKAGIADKEAQFEQILKNVITNIKLQTETDWSRIQTSVALAAFKV